MRAIVIIALTSAGLALSSLGAEAAPCCARYPEGASNCGFHTFAQCQATVSGRGGFCDQNSFEALWLPAAASTTLCAPIMEPRLKSRPRCEPRRLKVPAVA